MEHHALEMQYEMKPYPQWWNRRGTMRFLIGLPEHSVWNCYIAVVVLAGIWFLFVEWGRGVLDVVHNVSYALHVAGIAFNFYRESHYITHGKAFRLFIDVATFFHYIHMGGSFWFKFICYYVRLHRPCEFLWNLSNFNLKSSIVGIALKYFYIFAVLRTTWAIVWHEIDRVYHPHSATYETLSKRSGLLKTADDDDNSSSLLSALYAVNKMFIPIGPSVIPENDPERVTCLLAMMTGCLAVTGAAVASLSLTISLYLRPEETFRERYRLIIKEMQESNIVERQREKVQTFYKMYWHKQRAVSETQLLPTFPPTLPHMVHAEVYFEAMQKSKILCDLSYEFLSEVAKKMETKLYIPGDSIIKRNSKKSSIIFIFYGDIEMMTAEDDSTAILRMTRGTILSPLGACNAVALCRAHVEVRAATFCTAHVLSAHHLWHVAAKYGRRTDQGPIMWDAFDVHIEKVKRHYKNKISEVAKHKSSILHFKRCLMALKEARDADGNLLLDKTDIFLEIADCYIMRNRPDVSLSDEADAICLNPTFPCILQPQSSLLFAWNLFVVCLSIAVCFVHPYYLVYVKTVPADFRFFDYLATVVYAIDVVVHLSTGDNVEDGVPISFSQTSSQQMRTKWFLFDVLATLPIFEFVGEGHFAGINKLLKLPKVFRVLKGIEELCVYHSNVIRFLLYTLLLLIACYLIAALQQGVMCFHFDYCVVTNFTHSPFWQLAPLDEDTVEQRISFAMYWAISMIMFTTHKETWGTSNWKNVLFTMFVLEICIVLRIFMEAVYSATIMVTTSMREDYDASIAMVKSCFIRNNVDPQLRQRFITYLELCWYTDKAYHMTNKRNIFYDLPPHVYQDIVDKQRSKYILNIPIMKYLPKEILKTISSNTGVFYTSPNEIIINTGDIINEMYVIKQGICEIVCPVRKTNIAYIGEKKHFGVIQCLMRIPAFYTVRAVTHVEVFTILRRDLIQATEVPHIKDAIEHTKELPEYQSLLAHRSPFIAYEPPRPTPNTEHFKLPRKYEQDYDFLQPFYRLGYLSVLRYMFPRFTIRPDGQYLIRYEWFRAFCAFASAMVFPSYSYMRLGWPALRKVTFLLDLTAYYDLFQRMLVGYYNELGILVYHPASTAAHYLKGAFMVDLFGCIPWENLESSERLPDGKYRITEIKQLLMLGRLLQLYRLPSAMLVVQKYIERADILIVLRAIPMFMVLLNVLTGFVLLYSVNVCFYAGQEDRWFILPINDTGGSWIVLFQDQVRFNMTESLAHLHLATYFWVVYEVTTTGYNVFNPSNVYIMRVLFVGMLAGGMMITYFSVRIISIRANVNKALASFQEHMKDMIVYMKRENLDIKLQKEVFAYYEYNWDKMGGVDYRNVFKLCNQITLRTDAILHIYGSTFANCPLLSHGDVSLLRIVGRAVRSAYYLRDMVIIDHSDVITDMYFVDYGTMRIQEGDDGDSLNTVYLSKGSIFGNLDGAKTFRFPVRCAAATRVHLLKINSTVFHAIIKDFPLVQNLFNQYRGDRSTHYIKSDVNEDLKLWHSLHENATLTLRSRRSVIKYIFFKNQVLQVYLIVVSLACMYVDLYNAGFQDNRLPLIAALYAFDLAFLMKIILFALLPTNLKSTVAKRNLLLNKRKTYFKVEFKLDLLSCLPLELLCFMSPSRKWLVFSWLRLNRMFRIVTVYKCLKLYRQTVTVNLVVTTVTAVCIWFTLSMHAVCCLWYFIGMIEDQNIPKSSWMYKNDGSSWCHNVYVCSLYFILTTFTQNGVGDIMPKKPSEVVFVSILQIVSTMAYMVYVGEFSNIIQYQSFRAFSFYSMYLELQEFLKNKRVSLTLVRKVNRYSAHLWRAARGTQQPYCLQRAPPSLRLTVMYAAYGTLFKNHFVFQNCEDAFLRQLAGCLQIYNYDEDMFVVKTGEITESMYFIHRGKVQEIDDDDAVTSVFREGTCFGYIQGIFRNSAYTSSYKTLIKSQVLTLRLDDWLYLLDHFPRSKDAVNVHSSGEDSSDDSTPDMRRGAKRDKARVIELMDKSTQESMNEQYTKFIVPKSTSSLTSTTSTSRFAIRSKTTLSGDDTPKESEGPSNVYRRLSQAVRKFVKTRSRKKDQVPSDSSSGEGVVESEKVIEKKDTDESVKNEQEDTEEELLALDIEMEELNKKGGKSMVRLTDQTAQSSEPEDPTTSRRAGKVHYEDEDTSDKDESRTSSDKNVSRKKRRVRK